MNGLTKPHDFGSGPLTDERYVWSCAIGGIKPVSVPSGGDAPMRRAVERAFLELTGQEAQACFSGWGEEFAEPARAVIENRISVEEKEPVRADIHQAALDKIERLDRERKLAEAQADRLLALSAGIDADCDTAIASLQASGQRLIELYDEAMCDLLGEDVHHGNQDSEEVAAIRTAFGLPARAALAGGQNDG